MNNYCVDLNLPFSLFKENVDPIALLKSNPRFAGHFNISSMLLNKEIIKLFNGLGLTIFLVEVFYRTPNSSGNIHSDLDKPGDYSKLNWIFGGEGSIMNWYNTNSNYVSASTNTTAIKSYALYYKDAEVDLIHTQVVGQPSLVQVGIPHKVINSNLERLCVSVVFRYTDTNIRPTFNEALELFKDYIR